MPSLHLRLRRCSDGYFRTQWIDDKGKPHNKSFGKNRNQAQNRFSEFHVEWKRDPAVRNPDGAGPLTVRQAWERFKTHADAYYRRRDGSPTGEANNFFDAMRFVLELYGDLAARLFGPSAMKAVRERMILGKLSVNTINARVRKIRQVFRWLVQEELVPAETWHSLQAVQALAAGRSVVIDGKEIKPEETEPVTPVPEAYVWQVVKHVPPTVAAMIEFQYWTGARPGEVCNLRPIDIDRTGSVWIARFGHHKTAHHGKKRMLLIGRNAQAVIEPYLTRELTKPIFSPAEAWRQRQDARVAAYQPKKGKGDYRKAESYQQRAAKRAGRGGEQYDPRTYARLIARVCDEHDIPHWSPNRLRHNAATRLRSAYGLDVAQVVLGHSKADITQVYAELDLEKAMKAVEKIG